MRLVCILSIGETWKHRRRHPSGVYLGDVHTLEGLSDNMPDRHKTCSCSAVIGQDRRGGQRQIGCTWLEWLGCRSKPRLGMLEVPTIMINPWSSFLPPGSSYDCWVRDSQAVTRRRFLASRTIITTSGGRIKRAATA